MGSVCVWGGGSEVAERSSETLTASLGSSLETQPEAHSLHGFPEKNEEAHRVKQRVLLAVLSDENRLCKEIECQVPLKAPLRGNGTAFGPLVGQD